MIAFGTSDMTKAYIGSTEVSKVYLGSDLVWGGSSPALPYDTEVEYLQSSGTQYINLEETISSSTDVIDLKFLPTAQVSATSGVFGAREAASNLNSSCIIASNNNIVLDLNNGSYSTYRVNSGSSGYNKVCEIHMERAYKYIKFDGSTVASSTASSQSFTTKSQAYLFGVGNMSKPSIRVYSLQWRRSGDLFIDLIPVRVGTVGYMYDKISGELFGNAGTGSFTLGNDVV